MKSRTDVQKNLFCNRYRLHSPRWQRETSCYSCQSNLVVIAFGILPFFLLLSVFSLSWQSSFAEFLVTSAFRAQSISQSAMRYILLICFRQICFFFFFYIIAHNGVIVLYFMDVRFEISCFLFTLFFRLP